MTTPSVIKLLQDHTRPKHDKDLYTKVDKKRALLMESKTIGREAVQDKSVLESETQPDGSESEIVNKDNEGAEHMYFVLEPEMFQDSHRFASHGSASD
jgi:hypothetical protein